MLSLVLALSISASGWVRYKESKEEISTHTSFAMAEPLDPPTKKLTNGPDFPAEGNLSKKDSHFLLPKRSLLQVNVKSDPFQPKNWFVSPLPSRPVVVQQAAPLAPPLPFTYMGKFEDTSSGKLVIYLAKGDQALQVSEGDTFDGNVYRLSKIEKGILVFDYLPLLTQQRLVIGLSE